MNISEFRMKKLLLFKELKEKGLCKETEKKIVELYGKRGEKAIVTVKKKRVLKKNNNWIVKGRTKEYIIYGEFCSCMDYMMNIELGKAGVDMCYHALAKRIAEITGIYKEVK